MKKLSLFAMTTVIAALVASFALVGCGSQAEQAADPRADFVGTWQLVADDSASDSEVAKDREDGQSVFFVLGEDGSIQYELEGALVDGVFSVGDDGAASIMVDRGGWGDTMAIEDGKLVVTRLDGSKATFEKVDDSVRQAYDEQFGYEPAPFSAGSGGQALREDVDRVIVDDEFCTIRVIDKFEVTSVVGYDLEVTNKADNKVALRMTSNGFTVGERQVVGNLYLELPAGATDQAIASMPTSGLGGGMEALTDVKVQAELLNISDGASTLATYDLAL